ncbi:MAG: hypothetical protein WC996_06420 [Peptostreptococcales bacterium]
MVNIDKLDSAIIELESSSKDVAKLSQMIKTTEILLDRVGNNIDLLEDILRTIDTINERNTKINQLCENGLNKLKGTLISMKKFTIILLSGSILLALYGILLHFVIQ